LGLVRNFNATMNSKSILESLLGLDKSLNFVVEWLFG
jgi:hypothetical protein